MSGDEDPRLVDGRRMQFTRPPEVGAKLLAIYDQDEYPHVETEQDAWRQAGREKIAEHRQGAGDVADLLARINDAIEDNGGAVPVTISDDDVFFCGDDTGLRLRRRNHETEGEQSVEYVDVDELSPADLAELVADEFEPDELHRALAALAALSDDYSVTEAFFEVMDHANLDSEDVIRASVESGRRSVDEYRAILDDIEAGD